MKAIYNMALDRAVKEAGHRAAKADRRSLASLIELLLEQHCVARGYLPRPQVPTEARVAERT